MLERIRSRRTILIATLLHLLSLAPTVRADNEPPPVPPWVHFVAEPQPVPISELARERRGGRSGWIIGLIMVTAGAANLVAYLVLDGEYHRALLGPYKSPDLELLTLATLGTVFSAFASTLASQFVILGGAIVDGYYSAKLRQARRQSQIFSIIPVVGSDRVGASLAVRF